MFDVGFSELVVIALVALIVIGPERLPKVARTAGILLGRLQRYVNDVKADINREMQVDELKQLREQMASATQAMETSMTQEMRAVEETLNQTIAPLEKVLAAEAPVDNSPLATAAASASTPTDQLESGSAPTAEKPAHV